MSKYRPVFINILVGVAFGLIIGLLTSFEYGLCVGVIVHQIHVVGAQVKNNK
jgi:hypothetical protein